MLFLICVDFRLPCLVVCGNVDLWLQDWLCYV